MTMRLPILIAGKVLSFFMSLYKLTAEMESASAPVPQIKSPAFHQNSYTYHSLLFFGGILNLFCVKILNMGLYRIYIVIVKPSSYPHHRNYRQDNFAFVTLLPDGAVPVAHTLLLQIHKLHL